MVPVSPEAQNWQVGQGVAAGAPGGGGTLAYRSWTAYVRLLVPRLLLLAATAAVASAVSEPLAVAVVIAWVAYLVYACLMIRSYHLYFDDSGVWLQRGVLPWNRGVRGVKWRDLDEAVVFQSMWSWLFKSYTIRIGHRFTKSSELLVEDVARGHDAVSTVNAIHEELVRRGLLT